MILLTPEQCEDLSDIPTEDLNEDIEVITRGIQSMDFDEDVKRNRFRAAFEDDLAKVITTTSEAYVAMCRQILEHRKEKGV